MADDVKVLREAANFYRNTVKDDSGICAPALAIALTRMADMIEREGAEPSNAEIVAMAERGKLPVFRPDALQAAEDRGWNAALKTAVDTLIGLRDHVRYSSTDGIEKRNAIQTAILAIENLRRGPAS